MKIKEEKFTTDLTHKNTNLFKFITISLWILFFGCLGLLIANYSTKQYFINHFIRINSFTLLMWTVICFFSAIISSYSKNYLIGFKYHARFTALMLAFTLAVMFFVASEHIFILIISWFLMGIFMAQLIGTDKDWFEANAAAKIAHKWFAISTISLAVGLYLLAFASNNFTISGIFLAISTINSSTLSLAAILIIIGAIIPSALFPFQRWLLSAMTAPTPASALMHAGFVNGSGILLTLFSTVILASGTLNLLFIIGGLTAIIAQFTKLLQPTIKQRLACSTIAQMGFMIMQCGLGFFNAAIVHLILHGFYKAYLFLSSGENIEASVPNDKMEIKIKPWQMVLVIVFGLMGAYMFAIFTGKGLNIDSSIFLTLIIAVTVGQFTYNVLKQGHLQLWQKTLLTPIIFFISIGCYAFVYQWVTFFMADLPLVNNPTSLSMLQIIIGLIFIIGFFTMKLGTYRKFPWLYVKLLNISQPSSKTILTFKNKSL